MTDRIKGVVVTFGEDIRVDDAERILDAIRMVKGVIDVHPVNSSAEDGMVAARVRRDLEARLSKALKEPSSE